jgi:hypothetical protein
MENPRVHGQPLRDECGVETPLLKTAQAATAFDLSLQSWPYLQIVSDFDPGKSTI